MTQDNRPLVAGNWKMNGTGESLGELKAMADGVDASLAEVCEVVVCVPATLLSRAHQVVAGTALGIGGQDCHIEQSGAHTGDIAAEMLREAGASHVIVGHSERRVDHGESDAVVKSKARAASRAGLVAIICIGETREQRDEGVALDILSRQITGSVPADASPQTAIIAYEPIWAIGTGLTPTSDDIAQAHGHIREELAALVGNGAEQIRILYGGSVKPGNAAELMAIANVDGALVGGASLKASDFLAIAAAYRK